MAANVTHRAAVESDIDAVLQFWRSSAEDTDRHDDRPSLERLLQRDPDALLLAVADGEIIGSVIAGWDGWRCHLYRVAVRANWRRRGVVNHGNGDPEAPIFRPQGWLRLVDSLEDPQHLGRVVHR